ncbi:BQ2448_1490 [Microbotryum intermedium]|uniref:BQ2448_1490 protein n=1 Tax=Microbotryum intermedium TaxID=269621 RepID=A0A238FGC8_9BASI|nr:BQ2448_1490 [Microbotryum intermedium]
MPWAQAFRCPSSSTITTDTTGSSIPMNQSQRWADGGDGHLSAFSAVPTASANPTSAPRFRAPPPNSDPSGPTLGSTVASSMQGLLSSAIAASHHEGDHHDASILAHRRWYPRISYLSASASSSHEHYAANDQLASHQGSPTLGAGKRASSMTNLQHHGHGDAPPLQTTGLQGPGQVLMGYDTFRDPSPQGRSSVDSPNAPWSPATTSHESPNRDGFLDQVLVPFEDCLFGTGGGGGHGQDGGGAATSSASGAAGPAPAPAAPVSWSTSSPELGVEAAAAAGNPSSIFAGGDGGTSEPSPVFDPLEHYMSSFGPFSAPSTSTWMPFEHPTPADGRPRSFSHSNDVASLFAPQEMGRNNVLGLSVTSSPAQGNASVSLNTAMTPTTIKRFENHHLHHHSGSSTTAARSISTHSAPPSFHLAVPALPPMTKADENRRASLPTINHDVRREFLNRSMSIRNAPKYPLPRPYLPSNGAFDSFEGSTSAHLGHFHNDPDGTATMASNEMDPESPPSPFVAQDSHSPSSADSFHQSGRRGGIGRGVSRRPRSNKRSPMHNERGERISPVTGKPVRLLRKRSFPPKDAEKRVYACTITGCGRKFGRPSARDTHVRTHTGAKPYVCPVASCARSFRSVSLGQGVPYSVFSNLKRHMIVSLRKKSLTKKLCTHFAELLAKIHPSLDFRNVSVHDLPKIRCHEEGDDLRLEWLSTDGEASSPTIEDTTEGKSFDML